MTPKIRNNSSLGLGIMVSIVIMSIIYIFVITPISFFLKMIKKDILGLKKTKNGTYWKSKDRFNNSMKNQY